MKYNIPEKSSDKTAFTSSCSPNHTHLRLTFDCEGNISEQTDIQTKKSKMRLLNTQADKNSANIALDCCQNK